MAYDTYARVQKLLGVSDAQNTLEQTITDHIERLAEQQLLNEETLGEQIHLRQALQRGTFKKYVVLEPMLFQPSQVIPHTPALPEALFDRYGLPIVTYGTVVAMDARTHRPVLNTSEAPSQLLQQACVLAAVAEGQSMASPQALGTLTQPPWLLQFPSANYRVSLYAHTLLMDAWLELTLERDLPLQRLTTAGLSPQLLERNGSMLILDLVEDKSKMEFLELLSPERAGRTAHNMSMMKPGVLCKWYLMTPDGQDFSSTFQAYQAERGWKTPEALLDMARSLFSERYEFFNPGQGGFIPVRAYRRLGKIAGISAETFVTALTEQDEYLLQGLESEDMKVLAHQMLKEGFQVNHPNEAAAGSLLEKLESLAVSLPQLAPMRTIFRDSALSQALPVSQKPSFRSRF